MSERFGLPVGYSAEEAVDAVTCGPYGENTIVTPVTHLDGRQVRLTVNESVHYCPHPVKSKYYIYDRDAMFHPLVLGRELNDDQRLCIEDTLREYGVGADFEMSPPLIFVESDSQLIGEAVTRLAKAIEAVSKLSGVSS